jgi:hypothetical protein
VNYKLEENLNRTIIEKKKLESQGWVRSLTRDEKKEQAQEELTINRSIDLLENEDRNNKKKLKSITTFLFKLKEIEMFFLNLKVRKNNHFPSSMTFIRNPNYQGAHKLFHKIINGAGLDENLFENLLETEKIGVLDIPAIYERWCLVQIIKILIEKYHFSPEPGWKQHLMNQVLMSKYNIVLKFQNDKTDRKVCLSY